MRLRIPILLLFLCTLTLTPIAHHTTAQEIALRLAVGDFYAGSTEMQAAVDAFQAANPGVRVEVVSDGNRLISMPSNAGEISGYLSGISDAVSNADVIVIPSSALLPEATQAGYLLDLAPLTQTDSELPTDFNAEAWRAFQWDGGVWALPASYTEIALLYDPAAFEAAGLTPPDATWTLTELENAARTLAQSGASTPALMINSEDALRALIRGLLGKGVYDDSVIPAAPDFSDPALAQIVETLGQTQADGVSGILDYLSGSQDSPMMIDGIWRAIVNEELGAAPLPGGVISMEVRGFAVSRGTQNPEMAYALARFMTAYPRFTGGGTPAREGLIGTPQDIGMALSAPLTAMLNDPSITMISPLELRFGNYLGDVIGDVDSGTASTNLLQTAQFEVTEALSLHYAAREDLQINVKAASPPPDVPEGEIMMRFAVIASISPMPNEGMWRRTAEEFAEQDPEVGLIELRVEFAWGIENPAQSVDCFYSPYNAIPSADLSLLRALDPLLAADPAYDSADILGDVLAQVSRDGQVWALPVTLEPDVMWYRTTAFDNAGLPRPEGSWTSSEFTAAMQAFMADGRVITDYTFPASITPLLTLIAAYGGLPVDFRTDPVTINFTDPATVDAIRQVLDLAKTDAITYLPLMDTAFSSNSGTTPLILSSLDDSNNRGGVLVTMGGTGGGEYRLTTYPRGTNYTGVSYNVGAAYISADAVNPEACYRFIRTIAEKPELFNGMPVRHSQIESQAVLASRGEASVAFYRTFADLMAQPDVITFPASRTSIIDYPLLIPLAEAFDAYVLRNVDLEAELAAAEDATNQFLACVGAISISRLDDPSGYQREVSGCRSAFRS